MCRKPSNISTPEVLLEALNMMGNKLNEQFSENEKLKVLQRKAVGIRSNTWWKRKVGTKEICQCRTNWILSLGSREGKDYARIADPETLEVFEMGELTENIHSGERRRAAKECREGKVHDGHTVEDCDVGETLH